MKLTRTLILAGLGAAIGWFVGVNIGGVAPDFRFAGVRGYEAAGALGALIGAVAFALAGLRAGRR